jgi:hypothetical protein
MPWTEDQLDSLDMIVRAGTRLYTGEITELHQRHTPPPAPKQNVK